MKFNKNNKTFLKILSGLVAVVLWFAITYTEDPIISQHLGDIPVVFEGEKKLMDNGLIIVNKEKIPDISAVIRGKRSSVISAMSTITASCDVSAIEKAGENPVSVSYNYPASSITLANERTEEIIIETQKLITRNIPIKTVLKNEDKNGEYIIKPTPDAEKVRIQGAEKDAYAVEYAKVEIDVAEMSENNTQEYFYTLCDKDGNAVSENNIIKKSSETIEVENTLYNKVNIPIELKLSEELSKDYYLIVKNISTEKLNVGLIKQTAPKALYAEIKELSTTGEYKLDIIVPENIYIPEDKKSITAVCETALLFEEEIELDISIENNQNKFSVKPEKLMATIIYPEGTIIDGKVKATVDAKDKKAGDILPVKITTPDKASCDKEYTVELYIK